MTKPPVDPGSAVIAASVEHREHHARLGTGQPASDGRSWSPMVTLGGLTLVALVAVALGTVAARLTDPQSAFSAAFAVTCAVGLIGGVAAGPLLHRPRNRQ